MRVPRIRITLWRMILAAILLMGAYATAVRLGKGLGAATNLSDDFAWGIWIGFDVMCGVALAAGGFTVAGIVYVFHLERFRPILRPAILTAFLGYILAVASLILDLGHPYRIWHPMVMWNEHSVMFEVAWCVMLYTTVLALEFSPAVLERFRAKRLLHVLHAVTPLLVITGVLLSTLHQSSLGTLFVIMPNKLHGLWYTSMLPVLFYNSAIATGLAMTIFESTLSYRAFGVSLHRDIMASMAKAIVWVLGVYLVLKTVSLASRGNLGLIFEGSTESYLFILEMVMGVLLPIILFAMPRVRANRHGLFYTSLLVVLGVVLNRMNVSITGMQRYAGNAYFPSFLEIMTTIFILAVGFIAFALIARYFPIFPVGEEEGGHPECAPLAHVGIRAQPRVATPLGLGILVILAAVFVGSAYWSFSRDGRPVARADGDAEPVFASMGKLDLRGPENLSLPADYTFRKGESSPGRVTFRHRSHVVMGGESCTSCHPKPYKMSGFSVTSDDAHYGRMFGCGTCHDGKRSFNIDGNCRLCHDDSAKPGVITSEARLPKRLVDFRLPAYGEGYGSVMFSHKSHVVGDKLVCGDCHPRIYEMRRSPAPDTKKVTRTEWHKWGHECATCHDGTSSFPLIGNCAKCHTASRT